MLRPDDEEGTVKRRLDVYRAQTEPLIAFYEGAGARVEHVDGAGEVDDVQQKLVELLSA